MFRRTLVLQSYARDLWIQFSGTTVLIRKKFDVPFFWFVQYFSMYMYTKWCLVFYHWPELKLIWCTLGVGRGSPSIYITSKLKEYSMDIHVY